MGALRQAITRSFRLKTPEWTRTPEDVADDAEFDEIFGVQTAGYVSLKSLSVADRNWVFGTDYEPTPRWLFRQVMSELPVELEDYTFVDFGSGKGKALLLAAGYAFKSVIGVEISEALSSAAEANIKAYSGPKVCRHIQSVSSDAGKFPLPTGPLVLYIYNPFDEEVMLPVIANIKEAFSKEPRAIFIVLCYPRLEKLFEGREFRQVAKQGTDYVIFQVVESGSPFNDLHGPVP